MRDPTGWGLEGVGDAARGEEAADRFLLRPQHERVGFDLEHDPSLSVHLNRNWLLWRDELIESGEDDGGRLWELLVDRQRAWMQKPRG